jgi:hypothetical protein
MCAQAPAMHSSTVQEIPSLVHAVPSGEVDHALVLVAGWQD